MSNRVIVWPAKPVWPSARKLKEALKQKLPHKRILLVGSNNTKFKPRSSDIFINWGNSKDPETFNLPNTSLFHTSADYNVIYAVGNAVNKLRSFQFFQLAGIPTPEWTTDKVIAFSWAEGGQVIVCRTDLTGFGAAGIILWEEKDGEFGEMPEAPLYVKYKKKKHEFRVHVFKGEVIDVTWKRKRKGVEVDYKIRNYKNGWVYCRDDIVEPSDLRPVSIAAVGALGLDFGAVDVIWNEHENKCYVLEVNSAPGLCNTTLESYANAFAKEILK